MIVEIFGPPAAGKTTLSRALAERLRENGCGVDLALSYRPSEMKAGDGASGSGPLRIAGVARRLGRPAFETLAVARQWLGDAPEVMLARRLLALMPPSSLLWSARLKQYIWRLTHAWNRAASTGQLVIFDQGFVQAVCSLGLLTAPKYVGRLSEALSIVPRADFLIRLDAPRELLRERLLKREQQQGFLERLLEFDLDTNLRSIDILGRLEQTLVERGASISIVRSGEDGARDAVLAALERAAGGRPAGGP